MCACTPGVVAHTSKSIAREAEAGRSFFEVSPIYTASSRQSSPVRPCFINRSNNNKKSSFLGIDPRALGLLGKDSTPPRLYYQVVFLKYIEIELHLSLPRFPLSSSLNYSSSDLFYASPLCSWCFFIFIITTYMYVCTYSCMYMFVYCASKQQYIHYYCLCVYIVSKLITLHWTTNK